MEYLENISALENKIAIIDMEIQGQKGKLLIKSEDG